jgi:hypothetical protein
LPCQFSARSHVQRSEDAFNAAALRIAEEQGIFTWAGSVALDTPSMRGVELTVGDATMTFSPSEVAKILEQLT